MLKNKFQKYKQFLKKDIWSIPENKKFSFRSFFLKQLKMVLLALHKFDQKHTRLQAASMTYYSILAVVPTMTLVYGLMAGFGLQETLRTELYRQMSSHHDLIDAVFNLAQAYVESNHGTIFAGIGMALLLWTVFKTLITMENAFNDIWSIKEGKPIIRRLSDYLAIFLFCPLLVVISGSLTVYVSIQVSYVSQHIINLGPLASLIYVVLFFLPFIVIWMVFTFLYIFVPNTKVNFLSALWGGLYAGILYQMTQWSYIIFQGWISRSNAIYGSLAAFPLFLVWLQVSWMIILFGAEIAFARQYLKTYQFEPQHISPSPSIRKLTAVLIMYICVKNFEKGLKPWTVQQLAEHLHLPANLTQDVVTDLVQVKLLSQIHLDDSNILAYQPARTIDTISVEDVLAGIEHLGKEDIPMTESAEFKIVHSHLEKLDGITKRLESRVLLRDLQSFKV